MATLVALVLVAALGCSTSSGDDASASGDGIRGAGADTTLANDPNNPSLLIGVVASLSGSAQAYGQSQAEGIQLAVENELEGQFPLLAVELRDDASSDEGGTEAFTDLIEQGASVILGPTLSPVAQATNPLASAVGVPVLAVTNTTLTIDPDTDTVWRITLSEQAMLPQGLAAKQELAGIDTVVLVADAVDGYAQGAAAGFRAAVEATGVELLGDIGFDPDGLDEDGYRAVLQEAVATNPDALLLAARSDAATGLLQAAAALELPQQLIGSNGFNAPEVISAAGPSAEDLTVTASWNPAIDDPRSLEFVAAYTERFGRTPDAFAAQGYAAVQVVGAAAQAAGGTSAADIRRGLGLLDSVDTVLGTVSFSGNELVYPAAVQTYRDGSFELVARGTPQLAVATP